MIKPTSIKNISRNIGPGPFHFICCSSFEKRCLTVAKHLPKRRIKSAHILFNQEFQGCSEENTSFLCTFLKQQNIYSISHSDPIETADVLLRLVKFIIELEHKPNIVIDCTTFTRESLLILLKILHINSKSLGSVYFIYVAAKTMSEKWLSKGVSSFRSVLGYAGDFSPQKDLHLVLLLGFEINRAREIIDQYEPNKLSIGIGGQHSSINDDFYVRNQQFLNDLTSYYGNKPSTFTFSLTNPLNTKRDLHKYISIDEKFNVVISPLNNKLSTIGAGLFAIEEPLIQICYTQMDVYNIHEYSEPSEQCYIFSINFGEQDENT